MRNFIRPDDRWRFGLRGAVAFARGAKSGARLYPKPVAFDPGEEPGWIRAYFTPPIGKGPVEFMHREWAGPKIFAWEDMHPAMNVWGLYWREP